MAGSETKTDANPSAPVSADASGQSWAKRTLSGVWGIVLATGVVGTAISAYFQWRSWEYQTQTDKFDKDVQAAVTALASLDNVIDDKFLTTYDMDDAIKTNSTATTWTRRSRISILRTRIGNINTQFYRQPCRLLSIHNLA